TSRAGARVSCSGAATRTRPCTGCFATIPRRVTSRYEAPASRRRSSSSQETTAIPMPRRRPGEELHLHPLRGAAHVSQPALPHLLAGVPPRSVLLDRGLQQARAAAWHPLPALLHDRHV